MATAGNNVPELGGYDYEFISKVPEDWECLVCHLTLKDPVQIVGCGHRLCNICLESLFRRPSPACPADRQLLSREKIFPDAGCHRQILDLHVKCPYSGCPWIGELRDVEKHKSGCLFKVIKCLNSGCTKMLSKQDMETHKTMQCSWRKVNCEYCQESVIMNLKQKHFDICRKLPVVCTNKCGLKDIPREKLEVHVRDECPATEVQCEYQSLGCKEVFPRSQAKAHSQTQVGSHLNLALRGLGATQHQFQEFVTVVNDQSKHMSEQIEGLMSTVKDQSQHIKLLMSKVKEQSQQIERHELIMKMYLAPFEWKISNFQAICETAKAIPQSISSEPFYLRKGDYRYLLTVKVVSRPSNQNSYRRYLPLLRKDGVSLSIKVVPGEFDGLLSWPCKEKVRVIVIDQDPCQDSRQNISRVVDFAEGENPCTRPFKDDDQKYRFILNLGEDTLHTRSYIKNDSIFVMVNKE